MEFKEEAECARATEWRPVGAHFVWGAGFQRLTPPVTPLRLFEAGGKAAMESPAHRALFGCEPSPNELCSPSASATGLPKAR